MKQKTDDKQIISDLGGPSKVAELLGFQKPGGQQRVQNWLARGIPAQVKVDRPDLFMPKFSGHHAEATTPRAATAGQGA